MPNDSSWTAFRQSRIFCLTALLVASVFCDAGAAQECRWDPGYTELLGVSVAAAVEANRPVAFVQAAVTRPEKLAALGLYAVKKGDTVKLLCIGENFWRIKHYASGLAIVFSTAEP